MTFLCASRMLPSRKSTRTASDRASPAAIGRIDTDTLPKRDVGLYSQVVKADVTQAPN
ncbi:hypothetical protein [Streptomyces noursei]|uniref:hypothetical protein n=1 Tax=Streptomyces noursei TaxID=1971 RepID=UPI0015E07ACF|nr:hypothetical protein [Streptomyces noursei]